jgi:AraC-like DNA-binding protein
MYDQIREDTLFLMFYAAVAMLSLNACCYLLFRRANAIAPDVNSPVRFRRWTAALFAAIAFCHLWYLPTYFLTSPDDVKLGSLVTGLLDSMTVLPLAIVVLFTMLQDRKRPLWPVAVMMAPIVVGLAWCVATHSDALIPVLFVYFLLMCVGLIIYMIRAIRQYERWLCNNYADLENKEIWQSFVVLSIILLGYAIYLLDIGELIYEYATEVTNIVLICYLLWRVETLSDLSIVVNDTEEETSTTEKMEDNDLSLSIRGRSTSVALFAKNIGPLLKQHCEEPQLYLQYDISISQLASLIGINRSYLSKHFALQGTTYNAYINGLRIQHFIKLYHEAAETHQPVTAQQLAYQSGFRNYNTFSAAFKQMKGMTATEWMQHVKS